MTTLALLLVPDPKLLTERLGGMAVIERHLFTARRAGIERICIAAAKPPVYLRLPKGLEVRWLGPQNRPNIEAPHLTLSADRLLRVEELRAMALGGKDAQAGIVLRSPVSSGPALKWVLAVGAKSQDGFMARYFDRHLSLLVSRLLLDTPVTPNMMTIVSSAIGLYGTTFFLRPDHASRLTGAVLIWLHSVLDGCDGELARMRFQESPLGAAIDFWGDNLVHLSLFGCMAWGFYIADQSLLPLLCGLAAAVGTLGSASLVYRQKRRPRPPEIQAESFLKRLEDILAARDFIYLLVFLAAIDRTYEFMWAAGVGSLLFFLMTYYIGGIHDREQVDPAYSGREGQVGYPASGNGGGL